MLTGLHTLLYSSDAPATRRFFKDVLQWPCVTEGQTDEPAEWLIFRTGPSELGVHPTDGPGGERWGGLGEQRLMLMCDDLRRTMEELARRSARFEGSPRDLGYGLGVDMTVPGAASMLVYEPRHPVALDL